MPGVEAAQNLFRRCLGIRVAIILIMAEFTIISIPAEAAALKVLAWRSYSFDFVATSMHRLVVDEAAIVATLACSKVEIGAML